MCDLSDKLVAWLDNELPQAEAADLQQHVQTCAECRRCLASYKAITNTIVSYRDAQLRSPAPRDVPRWTPILALTAAAVALVVFFPRASVERHPSQTQVVAANPPAVQQLQPTASVAPSPKAVHKSVRKPRVTPAPQTPLLQNAGWLPTEPAIQIAIPAEAMFAPGAVPQGISFTAELRLAADGSAQELRLRP
jgi:anti-sigma factor RsiW